MPCGVTGLPCLFLIKDSLSTRNEGKVKKTRDKLDAQQAGFQKRQVLKVEQGMAGSMFRNQMISKAEHGSCICWHGRLVESREAQEPHTEHLFVVNMWSALHEDGKQEQ